MRQVQEELQQLVAQVPKQLALIPDSEAERRPAPGKWSKKEILGHLIDSAFNNHQRFVRAQLTERLSFPAYAQNAWIQAQKYQEESWPALITLWTSLNAHLAHLIARIPEGKLGNLCSIGDGEPVTLSFLVTDYLAHLEHHLEQIGTRPTRA